MTGETTSYTNWSPGEPNNGYSGENYAMFYYKYPTGKWNDGDFGGSTQGNCRAFICEWGPYSVHTHSYQYSVTPATVSKEGSISQKCSCGDEKNKTTIYCPSKVIFSKSSYTYTGKAQKPAFTLYDSKMNRIDSSNYTVTYESRACLKNHSCNLHAPFCGTFVPNSVVVARYDALIRDKFPTNCDAHLAESIFQTRSSTFDFWHHII